MWPVPSHGALSYPTPAQVCSCSTRTRAGPSTGCASAGGGKSAGGHCLEGRSSCEVRWRRRRCSRRGRGGGVSGWLSVAWRGVGRRERPVEWSGGRRASLARPGPASVPSAVSLLPASTRLTLCVALCRQQFLVGRPASRLPPVSATASLVKSGVERLEASAPSSSA